jgi:hypothetical protein
LWPPTEQRITVERVGRVVADGLSINHTYINT